MTTPDGDIPFIPANAQLPPDILERIAEGFYGPPNPHHPAMPAIEHQNGASPNPASPRAASPRAVSPSGVAANGASSPPAASPPAGTPPFGPVSRVPDMATGLAQPPYAFPAYRAATIGPALLGGLGPAGAGATTPVPGVEVVPAALALVYPSLPPWSTEGAMSLLEPPADGAADTASLAEVQRFFDTPAYYFLPDSAPADAGRGGGDAGRGGGDAGRGGGDAGRGAGGAPSRTTGLPGVRRDFPALDQAVNGKPLVWLDNAATTHKPQAVIDAVAHFYAHDNSNIHRGAHALAARATDAYEEARAKVAAFIGAASSDEVVWVRGTTEAVNLVAQSFGGRFVGPGDEVLVTTLEHHSNIVPWQMLCDANDAVLKVIPIDDQGDLRLDQYARLLTPRTRLVAVAAVSNVIGTVTPLRQIADLAHAAGSRVFVDGAQAVQHMPVDVLAVDADFFAFSGHKIFGPTGIGALYAKRELLEQMPPWQGGGGMIDQVTFERTTHAPVPAKFEAGTGHLAGAVGLGAAIEYVSAVGLEAIAAHEQRLVTHGRDALAEVPGLCPLGAAPGRVSALSFTMAGVAAERVGAFLDRQGIAVRAGHHCAQPFLRRFGLEAAVRASVALYNTDEEIDALASALHHGVRSSWE